MKIFFITFLVLNLLFESIAAVFLLTGPDGVMAETMPVSGMWAMNYGFAVIAMASAIFWVWPHRTNLAAVSAVLGILATFHIALTISLTIPGNQIGPATLHGALAIMAVFAYLHRHKLCAPSAD